MRSDHKRLIASIFTTGLVLGAVLLAPGSAAGIGATVTPGASSYVVGQDVTLNGSVAFSAGEFKRLTGVVLDISGPTACQVNLPLPTDPFSVDPITAQVITCTPSGSGTASVDVAFNNLSVRDGYGYGYGYGYGLLGSGNSASIDYTITWHAPIYLDPAPVFTLLPQTLSLFDVPQGVPPTPVAGLPDPLPTVTSLFAIPQLNSVPAGISVMPILSTVGSIPGSNTNPKGIAVDSNEDFIWLLTDAASGNDKLLKLNAADATLVNTFDAGDDDTSGLAFAGSDLWILSSTEGHDRGAKFQKINPADGSQVGAAVVPSNSCCDWGALAYDGSELLIYDSQNSKISSFDASDPSQSGNYNSNHLQEGPQGATGFTFVPGAGRFIVGKSDDLTYFDTSFNEDSSISLGPITFSDETAETTLNLRGLATNADGSVLYVADTANDTIYKAALPVTTQSPRGLALNADATSMYVLVDNAPNDSIFKFDKVGASWVQNTSTFGTSGTADAGSSGAGAIAFADGKLWVGYSEENPNCCQSEHKITALNATTGAAVANTEQTLQGQHGQLPGDITGMGSLDDDLYVGFGSGSGEVLRVEVDGSTVNQPNSSEFTNVGGLAVREGSTELFAVKGNDLTHLEFPSDQHGQITGIQSYDNLSLASMQGVAVFGDVLYLADAATFAVYTSSVPAAAVTITTKPKAMTQDGTDLFVVVEASPLDRIVKLDTNGNLVTAFGTAGFAVGPGDDVQGLAFANGSLWAAGSVPNTEQHPGAKPTATLWQLNASTGALTGTTSYQNLNGGFASLTFDGSKLVGTVEDYGQFQFVDIDPNILNNAVQQYVMGQGFTPKAVFKAGVKLWAAGGGTLNRYNRDGYDAQKDSSFNLSGTNSVAGAAYLGTTLFLADDDLDQIFGATFANNQPELTIAGSYGATLSATFSATVTSAVGGFTIGKATSVDLVITSPPDNSTVTVNEVTISGTVDDPSVTAVTLGAELASATLFSDSADNGQTSKDKFTIAGNSTNVFWHIDKNSFAKSNPGAWRYANPNQGTFDDGQANNGTLQIAAGVPIGEGAKLHFDTWYNSEGDAQFDRKILEINIVGDTDGPGWQSIRQIVDPFAVQYSQSPFNAHASFQFVGVQPADFGFGSGFDMGPNSPPQMDFSFNANFVPVDVDLTPFVGNTLDIRWRFDTVDNAANFFEGWYIDNIVIEGKGSGGGADTTPVVNGAWTTTIEDLGEGDNQIQFSVGIPYLPSITDTASITVNLDTLDPAVSIDQNTETDAATPDRITNAGSFAVTGTFVESNFSKIKAQNEVGATNPLPVFIQADEDAGTFTANATLNPGNNVITVTITDGAGRTSSAAVLILRDVTGPIIETLATLYPVGVVSARPGDDLIFQVNASDPGTFSSGVRCVEVLFPSDNQPNPCESSDRFKRPGQLPVAIQDNWGTTGGFIYPNIVPDTTLAGAFALQVRAVDFAGNVTQGTVNANITSALSAFNIILMPGLENDAAGEGAVLLTLPLIPDLSGTGNIDQLLTACTTTVTTGCNTLINEAAATNLNAAIKAIWYYDASSSVWLAYTPDNVSLNDTLAELSTGLGYWAITDTNEFTFSSPLGVGLPNTPTPINLPYEGTFLRPGAEAPPIYRIYDGWNSVGLHAEVDRKAGDYLAGLGRQNNARWSSLLVWRNRVVFPILRGEDSEPSFDLGFFDSIGLNEDWEVGLGGWLFASQAGSVAGQPGEISP